MRGPRLYVCRFLRCRCKEKLCVQSGTVCRRPQPADSSRPPVPAHCQTPGTPRTGSHLCRLRTQSRGARFHLSHVVNRQRPCPTGVTMKCDDCENLPAQPPAPAASASECAGGSFLPSCTCAFIAPGHGGSPEHRTAVLYRQAHPPHAMGHLAPRCQAHGLVPWR